MMTRLNIPGKSFGSSSQTIEDDGMITPLLRLGKRCHCPEDPSSAFSSSSLLKIILQSGLELAGL
jgi:hypothetical protein